MTWNLREAKPHVIWRGKFAHNGPIRSLAIHRGTIWFADGARVLAQNIATGQRVFSKIDKFLCFSFSCNRFNLFIYLITFKIK